MPILNPFALSLLTTYLLCLAIGLILIIYRKSRLHVAWSLFNFSVAGWAFFVYLAVITQNPANSYQFWRISHDIGIFVAIFFFHGVSLYCNLNHKRLIEVSYVYGILFNFQDIISNGTFLYNGVIKFKNEFYYLDAKNVIFLIILSFWIILAIWGNYKLFTYQQDRNSKQKYQAIFIAATTTLGFIGGASTFLPMLEINFYPSTVIFVPIYAIIITYGIFRHEILDVRIIVKKSLLYSSLITTITAIYLLLIFLSERICQGFTGYKSNLMSILIVLMIAAIFTPIKNKIQNWIDRIFLKGTPIEIAEENKFLRHEVAKKEKFRIVATLASSIAHEIRNPLTVLKTFFEYLPDKKSDPEFLAKFNIVAVQEMNRIENLSKRLLDFAKPQPPSPNPFFNFSHSPLVNSRATNFFHKFHSSSSRSIVFSLRDLKRAGFSAERYSSHSLSKDAPLKFFFKRSSSSSFSRARASTVRCG